MKAQKVFYVIGCICIFIDHAFVQAQTLPNMGFKPVVRPYTPAPINEFSNAVNELTSQHKASVKSCINEIKDFYKSLQYYVDVAEGNHLAYVTDEANLSQCSETNVLVKNGKIVSVKTEDGKYVTAKTATRITDNKGAAVIEGEFYDRSLQFYFFDIFNKYSEKSNTELSAGKKRIEANDLAGAISHLKIALQYNSKNLEALFYRGYCLYNLSKPSEALSDFSDLISNDVSDPQVYFFRGKCYSSLSEFDKAIDDFKMALNLNPQESLKHDIYISRAWAKYSVSDFSGMIDDCNVLIGFDKNNESYYYARGTAKSALGDRYGAIKDYSQAIKINPGISMIYNNRGWAKFELKDLKGALEDVNKAIELDNRNAIAFDSRGEIYFNLKEYSKSIEDCTRAIDINSDVSNSYYIRGQAKYLLKDQKGACEDWSAAGNLGHKEAFDLVLKNCQ